MSYLEILRLASPEATVVVAALVVLAVGLTKARSAALSSAIACAGLLGSAVAVLFLPPSAALGNEMLVVTPLTSLFKIVCLLLALCAVLLAHGDGSRPHYAEFLAMLLLGTVGLLLLVGSEELLTIFIGLELLGLALYVMTAFDKTDLRAAEAGLKYFLFGSTASAFTLFGLSFVYGLTGFTSLGPISLRLAAAPAEPLLAAGIVMTLIGFAFKVAAAPFHLWAPDAYQGAPISSAAFIASASKVASFFVLGKIVLMGFASTAGSAGWGAMLAGWVPLLAALAALSIVLGNLVALVQTNLRRLLAYSAVAHAGYTLLGIIAGTPEGFSATLFYSTIYAVTLLGAFGVVAAVRRETGGDELANFAGLRARSPLLAGCMVVFMLSLAGLPPLAGFFGKFYLFAAAFRAGGNHGLLWLIALALVGSLVSLYYYLVVLRVIFTQDRETHPSGAAFTFAPLQRFTVTLLAAAVLLFGVLPQTLVSRIVAALQ